MSLSFLGSETRSLPTVATALLPKKTSPSRRPGSQAEEPRSGAGGDPSTDPGNHHRPDLCWLLGKNAPFLLDFSPAAVCGGGSPATGRGEREMSGQMFALVAAEDVRYGVVRASPLPLIHFYGSNAASSKGRSVSQSV
jgi:hypothetical protein